MQSSPIPWPLNGPQTRKLLKELLRMHDENPVPQLDEVKVPEVAKIVWPYCHQVQRFAKAAMKLADAGFGHETQVYVRAALEYTVTAHYIAQLGVDGVNMWHDTHQMLADRTINESLASIAVSDDIRQAVFDDSKDAGAHQTALDAFVRICKELDVMPLYAWWATSSTLLHPTTVGRNLYFSGGVLSKTPAIIQSPTKTFEQMIIVLVWSMTVGDALLRAPKHEARLDEIAESIGRVKHLPARTPEASVAGYGKRSKRTRGWQPEGAAVITGNGYPHVDR